MIKISQSLILISKLPIRIVNPNQQSICPLLFINLFTTIIVTKTNNLNVKFTMAYNKFTNIIITTNLLLINELMVLKKFHQSSQIVNNFLNM